jgi:prepilin-type N-terminal cleavage/methylation domain-containing protein
METTVMTMPIAKRRRVPGFTLVEILVTVAIIALLIAILTPSLGHARAQAKTAACMSNLHQLGVAFDYYGHDSKQMPPPNAFAGTAALHYRDSDMWYYPHMVAKYVPPDALSQAGAGMIGVFACPAESIAGRAYSMNTPGDQIAGTSDAPGFNPYRIKSAYRYLLLGEAHAIFLDPPTGLYATRHAIGQAGQTPYEKFRTIVEQADRGPFNGYITFTRHRERSNFLLCDLSVKSLRTSQVVDDRHTRSCMEVWWLSEDLDVNPPAP